MQHNCGAHIPFQHPAATGHDIPLHCVAAGVPHENEARVLGDSGHCSRLLSASRQQLQGGNGDAGDQGDQPAAGVQSGIS